MSLISSSEHDIGPAFSDHEVRELPCFPGAELMLPVQRVGAIRCHHPNRFLASVRLVFAHYLPGDSLCRAIGRQIAKRGLREPINLRRLSLCAKDPSGGSAE